MRFSTHGSAAVAMAASLASATAPVSDRDLLNLDLPKDLSQPISANVDIGVDLSGTTLAAGVLANVAVPPVLGAAADVEVAIICDTCYTKGNINASINLENVVPALSLSLTDIEAKLDLDIEIGAAAVIAVNLFTPPAPISLPLPGLKVDALISLDLVLGVETAIDLSAGIDVKLVDEAHIETDILAGKILDAAFSGLSVQVLPVEVRIGCTKLLADLRLRVELGVAAEVDIDDIVPILDLPEIGAGLEVAVFANLLEYVGFFCATPSCPLSKESYGLNIGAAVELDVEVEDLLSLHLAPTLSTALLSYPTTTLCEHPSYTASVPAITASVPAGSIPAGGVPTGSLPGSLPSGSVSLPGSGSGSGSGYPSGSIPAITSSATAAVTTPAPNGGSITSTVTNTQTFTVTQCAATVPNCPAGYATTATLVHTTVFTTVCPATQTAPITAPPKATITKPAVATVTKETVTLTPCSGVSTFTPPSNIPTAPYPTGGKPAVSTTPVAASSTAPVSSAATTPAGKPTGSYPVNSNPARDSTSYPEAPVAGYPTAGVPSASESSPVGVPSASVSVPASSAPSAPAGGYPTGPAPSAPASSESLPVGSATASYPAGGVPSASVSVPASSAPAPSYPAGGVPSESVPATSATSPVGSSPSYPAGGVPVGPTAATSVPAYPTEIPPYPTSTPCTTLATRQPSASASYPSTPSYPAGETPIATAGAAKVGSGFAGLFALVGAVLLM
ncbi:hypothetical protein F4806DRAFT_497765 [Annulohypoxylon nitens]|nr:hypothetical protein F4806DRAFT_497765 [Annulohypoxylon nitens]KAI1446044.1 hypothetical protein F5Y02DRAFT_383966 [Annulohypoxylon stygium]